jgi:hypothetical protein
MTSLKLTCSDQSTCLFIEFMNVVSHHKRVPHEFGYENAWKGEECDQERKEHNYHSLGRSAEEGEENCCVRVFFLSLGYLVVLLLRP